MNYAKLIKQYREKKFMTQQEFANFLGVGIASVARWEIGKFEPTMKMKKKLHGLFVEAKLVKEDRD